MELTEQERCDIVVALARTKDDYQVQALTFPPRPGLLDAADRLQALIFKFSELEIGE